MPELPEVETIVRGLLPRIRGRRISAVAIEWPRVVDARGASVDALVGHEIVDVRRAGKFVVARLENGAHVAVHLRMTGRLIADPSAVLPHTRFVWRFDDGGALVFADVRKFGRLRVLSGDPERELGIGIDPFDPRLDAELLRRMLAGRRTPIKVWLLDQRFIAGIGNIYACEALYVAGIRPTRRSGNLSAPERHKLLRALRKVLAKAIGRRGSSVDDYVDVEGNQGGFQKLLAVYGRRGLPCRRCKTPIRRIVLAQRGTFFCPVCQRSAVPTHRKVGPVRVAGRSAPTNSMVRIGSAKS